jgi:CHAT domain-containing protein/Flp pilus assembly protein TadD
MPSRFDSSDFAVRKGICQAIAQGYLHQFEQAALLLSHAEQLATKSQPQLLGEVLLAKGSVAVERGDFDDAIRTFRKSLDHARAEKQSFLEANAAGSLGRAYLWRERYDEAIDWFKVSFALSQSLGARASSAKTLGNIGWSYNEMGDFENALTQFKEAEREADKAGLVADRIYWLNSAAGTEYAMGEYPAAESISKRAVELARKIRETSVTIECLQVLALVEGVNGQFSKAQGELNEALQLEGPVPNGPRQLYSRLISAHLSAKNRKFSRALQTYFSIARDPQSPTSIRWEAQAGLAEVHAALGNVALAEREFNASIDTISKARDALQHEDFRLSFLSSAMRFYNAYVDFLIAQHRPNHALAIAERSRAQTLTSGLTEPSQALVASFPRVNAQQLAARFHSTLLFYSLGTLHSHLWVITPQKTTLLSLPSQSEIDPLVKSYREQVLDGDNPLESPNSPASKLYSMLVQPATQLIPRNSRVIIFPDGTLNSLNFECLIVPRPAPHYWIEDVTLTNANSLTLLQRSQSIIPPQNPRLFLVGDPVSSDEQFPPLRQAAREMAFVKGYFPEDRRRILAGKDATSQAYLSGEPERFDFLHFVTHGTASRAHPLDSAVILTKSGDSAKLYAHEIITRPLHAYLVTVSACDGVGKRSYAGEGLVGLSWAFLRAGAHNVIASLWEVNDDSTPKLMDELYKGLRAGQDPATALRNAKLSLVRSAGTFRKPFYWAPFQLYAGS